LPELPDSLNWLFLALAVVGVIGVVWALAITRAGRRREQEVMRLSEEAHRIKDEFVAMVSHELRTPLTSIAGFADTLVASWRDLPPDEVDEFLGIISRQSVYLGSAGHPQPDGERSQVWRRSGDGRGLRAG
jgi:signal transduction histidine kinase